MPAGCGVAAQMTIGEETTYGTCAADLTRGYEFVSESLCLRHDVIQDVALGAGDYFPFGGRRKLYRRDAGGQVTLEVAPRGFGRLFKHILGGVSSSSLGSGAYLHTFTPAPLTGKSLTVQKGVPLSDESAVRPYTALGCKIAGWQLSYALGHPIQLIVGIDCADLKDPTNPSGSSGPALATATYPATPTYPFNMLYDGDGPSTDKYVYATLTKAGSPIAQIQALQVTGDNALDLRPFKLDASGLKREPLETGYRSVSGTLMAEFKSQSDFYDAFYGDSACALVTQADGALISGSNKEMLRVTLADVRFLGATPIVENSDLIVVAAPFVAVDKGDGSATVKVEYQTTDSQA